MRELGEDEMKKQSINEVNQAKRKVLLGATGVAVMGAWQAPIIKSVVLPAHAAASVDGGGSGLNGDTLSYLFVPESSNGNSNGNVAQNSSESFSPLDLLLAPAYAGVVAQPKRQIGGAKATSLGDGKWQVDVLNEKNTLMRSGVLTEGEKGMLEPTAGSEACVPASDPKLNAFVAEITALSETEMTIETDSTDDVTLPASTDDLPKLKKELCVPSNGEGS